MPHHDKIAKYYFICDSWYDYETLPKTFQFDEDVILHWDKTAIVDHAVEANQPDVVLVDRKCKLSFFKEFFPL
eukprot:3634259-Ditylum_brightwellii.AAC.1